MNNLINLYIETAMQTCAKMRAFLQAGDIIALGHAAHNLKSSSANMGALQFSALCSELESLGNAGGSIVTAKLLLDELDVQLLEVIQELESYKVAD